MIFDTKEIVLIAYLLLPGILANMSPVLFTKVNFLNKPVDLGKKIGETRMLGDNKTYRGLFFGILMAILVAFIQIWVPVNTPYQITPQNFWYVGFLLGFGALFGDIVESFFKRRIGIPPGKPWIPFDEIDHVIGALIMISFTFSLPLIPTMWIIILTTPIHIIINLVAYLLKLRKDMI